MIREEGVWPPHNYDSDDEELCTYDCPCYEKVKLLCQKAFNRDVHPITLRIKDTKTRENFEKFVRKEVLENIKYINVLLLVTFVIQLISYLPAFKEKGILLLNYIDLVLVCLII